MHLRRRMHKYKANMGKSLNLVEESVHVQENGWGTSANGSVVSPANLHDKYIKQHQSRVLAIQLPKGTAAIGRIRPQESRPGGTVVEIFSLRYLIEIRYIYIYRSLLLRGWGHPKITMC